MLDLGKNMMNFTNIFNTEVEVEKKEKRIVQAIPYDSEIIQDPLFKKIKALKKILSKCNNKTFTIKEDLTDDHDYEKEIKIEICHIFFHLLDIR